MGHATRNNEDAKKNEHPVKWEISTSSNKVDQGKWNREISGCDKKIRDDVQLNQPRVPKIAMAVRHEAVLTQKPMEEFHERSCFYATNKLISKTYA